MPTATELMAERMEREHDERSLRGCMARVVDRWTSEMEPHERAEFHADLAMLIQAVHRDAVRETHALLKNALAVMPPSQIIIRKD